MTSSLRTLPLYAFAAAAPLSVAGGNVAAGAILVAGLGVAALAAARPGGPRPWAAVDRDVALALGAYLAIHALATLAAPASSRWDKLAEEMWLKLLLLGVPVLAAGRPRVAERALGVLVAAGLVAALYGVFQHFTGRDLVRGGLTYRFGDRYTALGFFGHHLSYGGQAMLLLVVAGAAARDRLRAGPRRAGPPLAAGVVLGLGLLWSYARSAQLGALAAAAYLAATLPRRQRGLALAGLAAAVAVSLAVPSVRERAAEAFTDEKEVTRPNLWRSSVAGIADRPLLGWGPGNFDAMLARHELPGAFYESRAHAHNDFLMHAVNAGLLGLAAALALLATTTRAALRRRREGGGWVPLAAVAAQIAISVAGLFQVNQTDDEVEMVLYFVLGCALATCRRPDAAGPRPSPAADTSAS